MKTIAIIPVRGGSKSIPLKNIKLMNGRPLVYWVIDAAVNCKYIDEVYVSTDSEDIIKVVGEYDKDTNGKLNIFNRSLETATDIASTESAMLDLASKITSDRFVILQATSPLTDVADLNAAFEKYESGNFDSMLSVVSQKRFTWNVDDNGLAKSLNYEPTNRPRRQDFEGYYVENGAFYITNTKLLLENECRISGKTGAYEMKEETYFEIDEPSDWLIVEELLKKKTNEAPKDIDYANIKIFATDCDGVLTDAGMYYSSDGDIMKKFNTKDGMGFALLKDEGIIPAILTGENSSIVSKRAEKLQIVDVHLGCIDKVKVMEGILAKYRLEFENVAYIGDDINDLPLLKKVGVSFSVADAIDEVKESVHYVTKRKGGDGAVREAIETILSRRG